MPIATSVIDADLAAEIADLPASLAWGSFSGIPCAMTELAQGQTLVLVGNLDEVHFQVIFQASQIATASTIPKPTDRIALTAYGAMSPVNYEIVSFGLSPDGVAITLVVKADHRSGSIVTTPLSLGGQFPATNGSGTDAFAFAPAFPNSCTGVSVSLVPPTPSGPFVDCWLAAAPTKLGFSVQYAAPIPSAGYTLVFIASGT